MSVAVIFLGLTREAAVAKNLPDPDNWNESSPPFQHIRQAVFELFQATHPDLKATSMVEVIGASTLANLFIAGRRPVGTKIYTSIDRGSASFALLKRSFTEYPTTTFLLEVLMPTTEPRDMSRLLHDGPYPVTGIHEWLGDTVQTQRLLPFFGKWYVSDEKQQHQDPDIANFYLPYPRKDVLGSSEDRQFTKNLSNAWTQNLLAMETIKLKEPLVGGKLADHHERLFGCAYCGGGGSKNFGCGYCKSSA